MRKTLKITGIVLVVLVLLVIVAAVALPLLVDPNDFKPRIEAAVEDATGRNLEIPGEIELSVFPWLGVELGAVRLGNAPGFGDEPFAALEGAQVRVKLLPLLSRKVEIGKVVVEQPVIRLQRNAAGKTNWEDLAGGDTGGEKQPAGEDETPPELSVEGLEIRNARVIYTDAAAGTRAELTEFTLEAGEVGLPADFPLSMKGVMKLSDPAIAGRFEFQGRIAANLDEQRYALSDGTLGFDAKGEGLPVSPLSAQASWKQIVADMGADTAAVDGLAVQALGATLDVVANIAGLSGSPRATGQLEMTADDLAQTGKQLGELLPAGVQLSGPANATLEFSYDQGAGTAKVPQFALSALGIDISGALAANALNEAPAFKGEVSIAEFSPGQLLVKLGQELPPTRDAEVLDHAALQASFDVAPNRAVLGDIRATLDQTNLTGRVEVADIEKQALRFDLAIDQIDVDRYLPAGSEQAADDPAAETPLDQVEIPAELVRGLDVAGSLTIGKLKAFDFNSSDVNIGITARNDKLRVHPAEATFYGGGYRGDMRLDASGKVPVIAVDEHVDRVQLAPMVKDVLDVENISGTAEIDVVASARGQTVGDLRKALNGTFSVDVSDGAIEGFNLWESIREAYAKLKGRNYSAGDAPDRTEFAELSASGRIDKGVLHNDDLLAKLPFLRVGGAGEIDIAAATMDYTIEATVLKSPELTGGLEELTDVAIPVRLSGPIMDPSIRPDVKAVLEAKAKEALERKEQELRDEADRKIEEEKQRLEDKLKDKLKDFLG